ncbi:hypothetical protein DPMN_062155 [Dreissena polymorpha]|uniref:Elongator complex protein 2 n=1 Tax=Dreissena polymorpha TaxID=45954 RepID=A0A9D4C9B5_DREPO|nr:hypothetical protein DPMN_062155 [Dreissena polymorpha]
MAAPMNTCYISSGCNKSPHCADWGRNNLLCYGSCQAVVVCKPEVAGSSQARVLHTLSGHKANVNCVKWISKYTDGLETELVSGSVDNSIMVWGKQGDKFVLQQTLTDHQGAVTALDAAYLTAEDSLPQGTQLRAVIVSASTDSTVKIWIRNSDKGFIHKQNINFGCGFALDLSLIRVPGSETMMLAAASDDMKVHIYMEQEAHDDMEFVPVITLPGHEDWVRAVDFAQDDGGDLLLASASQDFLIRVWRLSPRVGQSVGSRSGSVMDLPPDQDIQMRETTFSYKIKGDVRAYAVSLETVLSGHENWIYSVCWKPSTVRDGVRHQDLSLLSVSMDKTMILWRPETEYRGLDRTDASG